jgi:hypothetical protein
LPEDEIDLLLVCAELRLKAARQLQVIHIDIRERFIHVLDWPIYEATLDIENKSLMKSWEGSEGWRSKMSRGGL